MIRTAGVLVVTAILASTNPLGGAPQATAAAAQAAEPAPAPVVVPLWRDGAPGFEGRRNEPEIAKGYWIRNVHNPSLTVYLPPRGKANGTGVVIFPGGGHRLLVFKAEGDDPARFLNGLGVAAFVVKYRLGRDEGSPYKLEEHPREDAYRAIRTVRSRPREWGVDAQRIGVMG